MRRLKVYCIWIGEFLADIPHYNSLKSPNSTLRYKLLQQRTARHDLFNGQNVGAENKRFQLKAVEFLLGTTNRLDDIIVLGMITQLSPGTYYLGRRGQKKYCS